MKTENTYVEILFNVFMWCVVLSAIAIIYGPSRVGPVIDACMYPD